MRTYSRLWHRLLPVYDEGEARAIVRLVLEDAFGLSWTDVVCGKDSELSADDRRSLEEIVSRLEGGEPVQYVLGSALFGGRRFEVAQGVLIPRPETEALCRLIAGEWAARAAGSQGERRGPSILDVGTGSGCIAVTLALDIPEAAVTAWDVSEAALETARRNARQLGAAVTLCRQDALQPPSEEARWDIVVSNPPYICEREQAGMAPHVVLHEPSLALFVPDDDPLRFYRAIGRYARKALRPGGRLFFEINALYGRETQDLLLSLGYGQVALTDDPFGRPRFVSAQAPR